MSPEILSVIVSGIVAILSLTYTIFLHKSQSITQTITIHRMDWIKNVRETIETFAHHYLLGNKDEMIDAKIRLELFMRRDTEEYRVFLEHIDECIQNAFSENDFKKLLLMSSYILARNWQRIRIEGKQIFFLNEKRINKRVTKQVEELHNLIEHCKNGGSV